MGITIIGAFRWMALDEKLLEKARNSPQNMTFEEATTLAAQLGFERVGGAGSHTVYHHPAGLKVRREFRPLTFRPHPGVKRLRRTR